MNKGFSDNLFSSSSLNGKYYLFLFLLWPFLAFITAVTSYSHKESRKLVYIFLIYYGLTFVMGELGGDGSDSERYAMYLKDNSELPFSDFFKIVGGLYTEDTSMDIVEPFISFIVSRFTTNYRILFAVFAAIFGFFYLKSINLLYNRYLKNPGWNGLIHLAFFTAILPITAINGFRMWTAAWIFFYGAYHVILYRDPRFLLIALGSSVVHWSFISANVILIIYYFAGNRNSIYLPIAIASFFFPLLMNSFFQSVSLKLGGGLQGRFEMYSDNAYIIGRQEEVEQAAWFLQIGDLLVFYYIILAMVIVHIKSGSLIKDKAESNLFSFLLLFLSFVNFGKEIPSFGGRFQTLFLLFGTLYIFLYFVKLPGSKVNLLTVIGLLPMILYTAILFRQGSESISAWILTPGLGLPLLVPGLSITDLLF